MSKGIIINKNKHKEIKSLQAEPGDKSGNVQTPYTDFKAECTQKPTIYNIKKDKFDTIGTYMDTVIKSLKNKALKQGLTGIRH